MKLRYTEIDHAIRTLDNAVLRATSDQHFEDAVGFKTAANVLRSLSFEIEGTQRRGDPIPTPNPPTR